MLSNETKTLINEQIDLLKVERDNIAKEMLMLKTRRDELDAKRSAVINKINKFQADLNS